jgi:GMP synthase-like glutamine amidotransferase
LPASQQVIQASDTDKQPPLLICTGEQFAARAWSVNPVRQPAACGCRCRRPGRFVILAGEE